MRQTKALTRQINVNKFHQILTVMYDLSLHKNAAKDIQLITVLMYKFLEKLLELPK